MRYLICFCLLFSCLYLSSSAQENPEPLFTLQQGGLFDVLISPDENYILTESRDEGVNIWDAHTGELVLDVVGEHGAIASAWSPNSQFLALGFHDCVKILSLDGEEMHILPHNGRVLKIVWYRDNLLYSRAWYENPDTGSYNGQESFVWDIEDSLRMAFRESEIFEGADWQTNLTELRAFSATIGEDPFVYHAVWLRTIDNHLIDTFNDHSYIRGMYWQDGTENPIAFFQLDHYSGTILASELYIFNPNGEVLVVLDHEDRSINRAIWNNDQSLLITWADYIPPPYNEYTPFGSSIRIWNSRGDLLHRINFNHWNAMPSWSPDSLFFMVLDDSNFYVYRTYNFELYRVFPHNNELQGAIWNHDGSHILAWSGSSYCEENCIYEARLWTRERELLAVFPHEAAISEAIWFQNETRILTRSYDTGVKVWDVSSLMN